MRVLSFDGCAFSSCAALAVLAGCGGLSQSATTLPQSSAVGQARTAWKVSER
jgi:hypothetical protein